MATPEPSIRLLVAGPGGTREVLFDQRELTIGRDSDNDVILYASFVSRKHAVLSHAADVWVVADCGSKNGVAVNRKRITVATAVRPGDEISIGAFSITVLEPLSQEPTTEDFTSWRQSISVDPASRTIRIDGAELKTDLSTQEFDLLWLLYENPNKVLERERLGATIWGEGNFDANMVHRLVRRLRLKIEPDPSMPRFIHAVPGLGYILKRAEERLRNDEG